MKLKDKKYIDPWVLKKFRWPGKGARVNQYAFHIGLLDKYSKNVPAVPAILKQTWGTNNKGVRTYFSDTRGAAV
jgi:hypothetical protein